MLTSVVWGPFLHDVRGRIATLVVDVPLMTGHLRRSTLHYSLIVVPPGLLELF